MNDNGLDVTVVAALKHGVLWRARQKVGSNKALAIRLGVPETEVGRWLSLKAFPSKRHIERNWYKWELALYEILGFPVTVDELFPASLTPKILRRLKTHAELSTSIPLELLIDSGGVSSRLLRAPDADAVEHERSDIVRTVLDSLPKNQRDALVARFFEHEDESTKQIATRLGKSVAMFNMHLSRGLRMLRQPRRAKHLRKFFNDLDGPDFLVAREKAKLKAARSKDG